MKENDKLHGFTVKYVEEVPEIKARLVRMEYDKNGADLVWLDRDDDNMTFAIAFKTIPEDSTGVFHILEHSVLSGSKNYPVKEPFVELLKSSMSTFLNAFTFPDKTMYPVCSRNKKDFMNLMDVYLDAVLHPLSIYNPQAFLQEGWHYELESPESELSINGVVYNEMKGVYASPDSVLMSEIQRLLYPDNCYGFESGGHPDHIPELTYENYLESHRKFYHPSNSRIFLDGAIDTDAVLGKLDKVLSEYDKLEMDTVIPMQKPVKVENHTCLYEIGEDADDKNKAILAKAAVIGTFEEPEKLIAYSMLKSILCGSNESPLVKALLESGLVEDVEFSGAEDGVQQPFAMLVLRNVDPDKKDEIWSIADEVLRRQIKEGFDKEQLHAALNYLEFSNREKETGFPIGLAYGITSLESWLYDGDPKQNLCREKTFETLRAGIDSGYYEKLLEEFLDAEHSVTVCMLPSKTLGRERQEKEAQRLAEIKASASDEWLCKTAEDYAVFCEKQNTPDTPEAFATLPTLSLDDVTEEITKIPQNVMFIDNVTVLHQPVQTDGITYLTLHFALDDIPMEKMHEVALLSTLLGGVATEKRGPLELMSTIESRFGRFSTDTEILEKDGEAKPYLVVTLGILDTKLDETVEIIDEVLNHSLFTDSEYIFNILRQERIGFEQQVIGAGNIFAAARAGASVSVKGALDEVTGGITHLKWMQKLENEFESRKGDLTEELSALSKKIFSKERVIASLTGNMNAEWLSSVLSVFNDEPMGDSCVYEKMPISREGFMIPAEIGFAARVARNFDEHPYAAFVASHMLTYGHLWTEVRVKGGAYGTGMRTTVGGLVRFYSYRDPNPKGAMSAFNSSGDYLRQFCSSGDAVDRYIISTISDIDPLLTPRKKGAVATTYYLVGRTDEKLQEMRSGILHTTKEDLLKVADILDSLIDESGICVVGGKNVLDACGDMLDTVESVQ